MKKQRELVRPRWKSTKDKIVIEFDRDWLLNLAASLNDWEHFTGWTGREDCKNWKRSPVARENRRESIVLSNCLSTVKTYLGRREMLKLMAIAKRQEITSPIR